MCLIFLGEKPNIHYKVNYKVNNWLNVSMFNKYFNGAEIKNGIFAIIPYDFVITHSKKQCTKNLLTLAFDGNDKKPEVHM